MPRERLDVLVVGAGSIGERHIRCIAATGRARVAFVEVRAVLREEMACRYPGTQPLESLEAALGRRFDAAVVATPAQLHVPQAMQLIERDVHVLIEKPLSVTLTGVEKLIQTAKAKQVVASVAYVYRAHPALAEMREEVRSGRFGRPIELVAVCGQHFPLYRPAYAETYYSKHESGGGTVQDALTHVIDAGQWLVGDITSVVGDVAHQVLPGVEVEDTAHVLARHNGDVLASYSINQHQAPNEFTITVICERGTARFEYHNCRWRFMQRAGDDWTDGCAKALERDTLFTRQSNAFLDAVEGKAAPVCTLEEGMQALRVNLAILHSVRDGAWVSTVEGASLGTNAELDSAHDGAGATVA